MTEWKMPPKAKFYEALGAVADQRIKLTGNDGAEVLSSDRSKTYIVKWSSDVAQITSNDNASYWQGYVGYPMIAALLTIGRLRYEPDLASVVAGVPWKALNDKHRRNYDKAIAEALHGRDAGQVQVLADYVETLAADLERLGLQRLRSSATPPTGGGAQ